MYDITFLDLETGCARTGQYWSDAELVTGTHALWVVAYDTGRPVHIHKPHKRHRDTQRALRAHPDVPEYITGVRTSFGNVRYDRTAV